MPTAEIEIPPEEFVTVTPKPATMFAKENPVPLPTKSCPSEGADDNPVPPRLTGTSGRSAATKFLKYGAPAEPLGAAKTVFAALDPKVVATAEHVNALPS
ncbi:hypothetical protein D3C87_1803440 [compost metagenome]